MCPSFNLTRQVGETRRPDDFVLVTHSGDIPADSQPVLGFGNEVWLADGPVMGNFEEQTFVNTSLPELVAGVQGTQFGEVG